MQDILLKNTELFTDKNSMYIIPTIIQQHLINKVGIEGFNILITNITDETFMWSITPEGFNFWEQILLDEDMYDIGLHFNIDISDSKTCPIHTFYRALILSRRNGEKLVSIFNKILSRYEDINYSELCFFKDGNRVFKCPHCGKPI